MFERKNIVRPAYINSTAGLSQEIARLQLQKEMDEQLLKDHLKEMVHCLQPGVIVKKAFGKLREDNAVQQSAVKTSLDFGAQFLLDKMMIRKGIGLKGYVMNMILKKVVSFVISKSKVPSSKNR